MAWLDPLWVRFHGLHRPPSATADDAVAVLRELGVAPDVRRWERTSRPRQDPDWVTRRLCLPAVAIGRGGRGAGRPDPTADRGHAELAARAARAPDGATRHPVARTGGLSAEPSSSGRA